MDGSSVNDGGHIPYSAIVYRTGIVVVGVTSVVVDSTGAVVVVVVVGAAVEAVAGSDESVDVVMIGDAGTEATVDAPVSVAGGAQPTAKNTNAVASDHHTRMRSLHPTVSPRSLDRSRINLATAHIRLGVMMWVVLHAPVGR